MARPKKKPEYDSDQMVQQLMEAVTDAYLNPPQGTGSFPNKRILETIHETPACVKGITIEYYIF